MIGSADVFTTSVRIDSLRKLGLDSESVMRPKRNRRKHAAYSIEHPAHAASSIRHAPCNMQHATCTMQHATCNMQHATCTMQHAPYDMRHATCRMLACSIQNAACIACDMYSTQCHGCHAPCWHARCNRSASVSPTSYTLMSRHGATSGPSTRSR